MAQPALYESVGGLADAVLDDWRWSQDDLSVSVLGMLLYGYASALAGELSLPDSEIDAAVLQGMTERAGAAAKWSSGLVAEARRSGHDKSYHPGQHSLIRTGMTYANASSPRAVVDNVYANFASFRRAAGGPEPTVLVFLNPLVVLLAQSEKRKGAPLTEAEVLKVRDGAACTPMPLSQAEKFYASLDVTSPYPRFNPARVWKHWQLLRRPQT